MISAQTLEYTTRGIIQYLNGDRAEFEKLIAKAMEFNIQEPVWTSCMYKKSGKRIKAKINFGTGVIVDLEGNVLREGKGYEKV